ncbi:MAG TPA: hypothetical protein DEB30_00975 [Candidatus Peribacter riflensis]|nr:MAG: hypothetical protein A2398_05550 [Candidatus Peribacteria bacterium RIFOXYB1_FULL_57_12]HBH20321.1 hypothetical protein [Candidatus Peribacter riflensis]HBU09357.1 hypothetical protein [Candidatus Peribacter riflensis]
MKSHSRRTFLLALFLAVAAFAHVQLGTVRFTAQVSSATDVSVFALTRYNAALNAFTSNIQVSNNGTTAARSVTLVLTSLSTFTIVTPPAECRTSGTRHWVCPLGNLEKGARRVLTFTVTLTSSAPCQKAQKLYTTVIASQDKNIQNNSQFITVFRTCSPASSSSSLSSASSSSMSSLSSVRSSSSVSSASSSEAQSSSETIMSSSSVSSAASSASSVRPICGNGVMETGEECDDGNAIDTDGCLNICRAAVCGNGIVEGRESCDDGNLTAGDGCYICRIITRLQPRFTGEDVERVRRGENLTDVSMNLVVMNAGTYVAPSVRIKITLPSSRYTLRVEDPLRCDQVSAQEFSCILPSVTPGGSLSAPLTLTVPSERESPTETVLVEIPYTQEGFTNEINSNRAGITFYACGNSRVDAHLGESCDDGNRTGRDGCGLMCNTELQLAMGIRGPDVQRVLRGEQLTTVAMDVFVYKTSLSAFVPQKVNIKISLPSKEYGLEVGDTMQCNQDTAYQVMMNEFSCELPWNAADESSIGSLVLTVPPQKRSSIETFRMDIVPRNQNGFDDINAGLVPRPTLTFRACGNGIRESWERCDTGPANGTPGGCPANCR